MPSETRKRDEMKCDHLFVVKGKRAVCRKCHHVARRIHYCAHILARPHGKTKEAL